MRSYTVPDILALGPCGDYPEERIREIYGDRHALTAREIAAPEIDLEDRIWTLIGLLPDDCTRRLWACDIAEAEWIAYGAPVLPDERRPLECIAVARRYARGEATVRELVAAVDAVDVLYYYTTCRSALSSHAVGGVADTGDEDAFEAAECVACRAVGASWDVAWHEAVGADTARDPWNAAWKAAAVTRTAQLQSLVELLEAAPC